jgi:hypothetical protein
VQLLWKSVWKILKKLKIELPYDSAIALLGTCPKEWRSAYKRDTFTPKFYSSTIHNSHTGISIGNSN